MDVRLEPSWKEKLKEEFEKPYFEGLAGFVRDAYAATAVYPPPSCIFQEIHDDLGLPIPKSGNLKHWADQGVLLLNATLTVEAGQAGSHQGKGWEAFTDAIIRTLAEGREGLVFLLWGAYAQKKGAFIDRAKHLVLTAPHPSPLSASNGFFGCRHFSKTNAYLASRGELPIEWVKDAPKEIDVRNVQW